MIQCTIISLQILIRKEKMETEQFVPQRFDITYAKVTGNEINIGWENRGSQFFIFDENPGLAEIAREVELNPSKFVVETTSVGGLTIKQK